MMKFGILFVCILLGITACANPAPGVSGQSSSNDELSQETTQYATGYSLEQIGLKAVFPEKVEAYPFENNLPRMFTESGVRPAGPFGLRDRFKENHPSLEDDIIYFNGGWSMTELTWHQTNGIYLRIPAMLLQAFKKSDIDGGMMAQYISYTRNDLCVELSKEELMKYLWRETDEYYIVDFLDVYISDYRVFACEAALYHLDTAEYQDETPMYLDFNTYLEKINDVRNELKDKITLE